jgi:hypothetical protein
MRYIDTFSWTRDYGGTIGVVNQAAIVNRQAASNDLTELECTPGSLVCAFESILFASMFRTPGVVSGSGIASMQLGSQNNGRREQRDRALRGGSSRSIENDQRLLQEDDDDQIAAVAEFDLSLEAVPVFNPYLDRYRNPSSAGSSLSSVQVGAVTTAVTIYTLLTMVW